MIEVKPSSRKNSRKASFIANVDGDNTLVVPFVKQSSSALTTEQQCVWLPPVSRKETVLQLRLNFDGGGETHGAFGVFLDDDFLSVLPVAFDYGRLGPV